MRSGVDRVAVRTTKPPLRHQCAGHPDVILEAHLVGEREVAVVTRGWTIVGRGGGRRDPPPAKVVRPCSFRAWRARRLRLEQQPAARCELRRPAFRMAFASPRTSRIAARIANGPVSVPRPRANSAAGGGRCLVRCVQPRRAAPPRPARPALLRLREEPARSMPRRRVSRPRTPSALGPKRAQSATSSPKRAHRRRMPDLLAQRRDSARAAEARRSASAGGSRACGGARAARRVARSCSIRSWCGCAARSRRSPRRTRNCATTNGCKTRSWRSRRRQCASSRACKRSCARARRAGARAREPFPARTAPSRARGGARRAAAIWRSRRRSSSRRRSRRAWLSWRASVRRRPRRRRRRRRVATAPRRRPSASSTR